MSEQQQDRQDQQDGAATLASGIESSTGPAGADGPEGVDVSGADLDVEGGSRQESGSALDADQFDEGAADSGGTGGANAGGAG
jgi:hypothetical protein